MTKKEILALIERCEQDVFAYAPVSETFLTNIDTMMVLYTVHPMLATLLASGMLKSAAQIRHALSKLYAIAQELPDGYITQ